MVHLERGGGPTLAPQCVCVGGLDGTILVAIKGLYDDNHQDSH